MIKANVTCDLILSGYTISWASYDFNFAMPYAIWLQLQASKSSLWNTNFYCLYYCIIRSYSYIFAVDLTHFYHAECNCFSTNSANIFWAMSDVQGINSSCKATSTVVHHCVSEAARGRIMCLTPLLIQPHWLEEIVLTIIWHNYLFRHPLLYTGYFALMH